jgi:hypothetical protein
LAQRCAKTTDLTRASGGAGPDNATDTVTIAGVGAVPRTVAGALAGLAGGTVSCMTLTASIRERLKTYGAGT